MKDLKVQRAVTTELAWEPSLHSADIAVSVKSGIATLNGTVRSLPESGRRKKRHSASRELRRWWMKRWLSFRERASAAIAT